jgi:hypothetical protein
MIPCEVVLFGEVREGRALAVLPVGLWRTALDVVRWGRVLESHVVALLVAGSGSLDLRCTIPCDLIRVLGTLHVDVRLNWLRCHGGVVSGLVLPRWWEISSASSK